MKLREYASQDLEELMKLFYDTVHNVNAGDYTKEQLDAWAERHMYAEKWDSSLRKHHSIVAVEKGSIVGFGDMDHRDEENFLDRLFVHKDYQREGIGTAICDCLESETKGKIVTHASVTAKPFFEKRGYRAVKKHEVIRRGITLTNYLMEKFKLEK